MKTLQQSFRLFRTTHRQRSILCFVTTAILSIVHINVRAENITVTHWGASFYGAPYAVAMQKGWFKTDKFDVTGIITSTGGGTSVRNTLASNIPIG